MKSVKSFPVVFAAILTAVLGFSIYSCSDHGSGSTRIEGSFPGLAGDTVYLQELDVKQTLLVYKMKIRENGYFSFKLDIKDAGFYMVRTSRERMVLLLVEPGEKVRLVAKSKDFHLDYEVYQSKGSALLRDFEFFMNSQKARVDSLHNEFLKYQYTPQFAAKQQELDSVYQLILKQQKNYVKNFIDSNPSSLASLIVINRKFGRREVLNEIDDLSWFRKIDDSLMKVYPENKHALDHHRRMVELNKAATKEISSRERLASGKTAPELTLPDSTGKMVSLSSLKNKKVLLYFWAGWNARSRQDNIRLKNLYNKTLRNDFEIFAVSFDNHERVWKGAIRLDKLPWINVSDLKGVSSPVNELYNLKGQLPYFYVLDQESRIVEKAIFLDSLKTLGL